MTNWTPEEAAKMLAGRTNQPHYVESVIRKVLAQERAALEVELPKWFTTDNGPACHVIDIMDSLGAAGIKIKGDV